METKHNGQSSFGRSESNALEEIETRGGGEKESKPTRSLQQDDDSYPPLSLNSPSLFLFPSHFILSQKSIKVVMLAQEGELVFEEQKREREMFFLLFSVAVAVAVAVAAADLSFPRLALALCWLSISLSPARDGRDLSRGFL